MVILAQGLTTASMPNSLMLHHFLSQRQTIMSRHHLVIRSPMDSGPKFRYNSKQTLGARPHGLCSRRKATIPGPIRHPRRLTARATMLQLQVPRHQCFNVHGRDVPKPENQEGNSGIHIMRFSIRCGIDANIFFCSRHINTHDRPYKCHCGERRATTTDLKRHQAIHEKTRIYFCSAQQCIYNADGPKVGFQRRLDNAKRHIRTAHKDTEGIHVLREDSQGRLSKV